MKNAAIVVNPFYFQNRLFNMDDPVSNRDDVLYCFFHLQQELLKYDINLCTCDINKVEESEIVIFNDLPQNLPIKRKNQKFFLLAMESIAVLPENYSTQTYALFDKVFTWHDSFIDDVRVFKINYSFLFKPIASTPFENKSLVCMMANNKDSSHPHQLYTERIKIINWFERNHVEDFALYGGGWDRRFEGVYINKVLCKLRLEKYFRKNKYASYKGIAAGKLPVLSSHKFNVCFENIRDIPGYISEKIFDTFFAGCVPVYWGANNILDYIPQQCFVDPKSFPTIDDLYAFLKNMNKQEYENYIYNIKQFLLSDNAYQFSTDHFSKKITKEILSTLSN